MPAHVMTGTATAFRRATMRRRSIGAWSLVIGRIAIAGLTGSVGMDGRVIDIVITAVGITTVTAVPIATAGIIDTTDTIAMAVGMFRSIGRLGPGMAES